VFIATSTPAIVPLAYKRKPILKWIPQKQEIPRVIEMTAEKLIDF